MKTLKYRLVALRFGLIYILICLGIASTYFINLNQPVHGIVNDIEHIYIPAKDSLYISSDSYYRCDYQWCFIGDLSRLDKISNPIDIYHVIKWYGYRAIASMHFYINLLLPSALTIAFALTTCTIFLFRPTLFKISILLFFLILIGAAYFSQFGSDPKHIIPLINIYIVVPIALLGIAYQYIIWKKHRIPKAIRWVQDLLKIDPDNHKKGQLDIKSSSTQFYDHNIERLSKKYLSDGYFLGIWNDTRQPIVIPEQQFSKHTLVLGPTSAGKTIRVATPLAMQALKRNRGIAIIDYKGDKQCISKIHELSCSSQKSYYLLSLTNTSHSWNAFEGNSADQIAERIILTLDLQMTGDGKFYTHVQKALLIPLIEHLFTINVKVTPKVIYESLIDQQLVQTACPEYLSDKKSQGDLKGLRASLLPLSRLPQINDQNPDINISNIIQNGDILYCHLSSQVYPDMATTIGKLLYQCIQSVSSFRTESDPPYFIIIDEWQDAACKPMLNLLSKIRSSNICLVLANQSEGQLNIPELGGESFLQTVRDNTGLKIVFRRMDGDEAERWASCSGTEPYRERGQSTESGRSAYGRQLTRLDGLRTSDGNIHVQYKHLITANSMLSLGDGCAAVYGVPGRLPSIASFAYPWDLKEKRRLEKLPWPNIITKNENNSKKTDTKNTPDGGYLG